MHPDGSVVGFLCPAEFAKIEARSASGRQGTSDTVATLSTQIGLTKKYLAKKAGQDVSEMAIETTITERPKKRKSKKASAE